jgi:hypothetical protein
MTELLFGGATSGVLHMESPSRQSWAGILRVVASKLGLSIQQSLPYAQWLEKVKAVPDAMVNPCVKIIPFLEDEFIRMVTGEVVLDTVLTQRISPALHGLAPLSDENLVQYIEYWKREKFLE